MVDRPIADQAQIHSDLAIPPGETLLDELRERGITQKAFAGMIGRPYQVVNAIVNGKKAITAETALQFEKALGISAVTWMNIESAYRLALARRAVGKSEAVV
ncbi:MAG: HigA family addiction module antitoxin [Chloroflexi bacterium]|nr:HigA family addiction module antitoxin [Chloroflexota bacterium]